ncbi:MAG TPA: methionyl-tRNA formyltransferase [Candidatus Acidoferrales bacterium]|jgi:methionyl-tRNA formyltransferase|nr:methionyl-tRNA formyltransferase [Candidatus Acidoferrales bacterium]
MTALRIVFCGTPEFAVPSLRRLAECPEFSIQAVISQPDRPRGRGGNVTASPVKETALELGLHVYQPESIKSESSQDFLKRLAPDAVVIIAYGQIIPARLLTIPRLGWLNVHGSLLPKYRGAAPIHWAIANGETVTGITTMQINAGMDTGPTLLRREVAIGPEETSPELAARMSADGADLIVETLLQFDRGEIAPSPQEETGVSYSPILKKEDGRINWRQTAQQIYNRMRAFTPWPGSYSTFRGQTCHLWGHPESLSAPEPSGTQKMPGEIVAAAKDIYVVCGEKTILRLDSVQVEGRKKNTAREFANGAHIRTTERFI